jgi:hypothetical protein
MNIDTSILKKYRRFKTLMGIRAFLISRKRKMDIQVAQKLLAKCDAQLVNLQNTIMHSEVFTGYSPTMRHEVRCIQTFKLENLTKNNILKKDTSYKRGFEMGREMLALAKVW